MNVDGSDRLSVAEPGGAHACEHALDRERTVGGDLIGPGIADSSAPPSSTTPDQAAVAGLLSAHTSPCEQKLHGTRTDLLGNRAVEPPKGKSPHFTSVSPNCAERPATRRSHAATSVPPPSA